MSNVKVDPQPRVNASQLSAHIGNSVLLVGQMLSRDDGRLVLTAADKKSATVLLGSCAVPAAKFLEVSGVVKADMSIVASSISALGDSFDMDNYNKACELLPGFKSLF